MLFVKKWWLLKRVDFSWKYLVRPEFEADIYIESNLVIRRSKIRLRFLFKATIGNKAIYSFLSGHEILILEMTVSVGMLDSSDKEFDKSPLNITFILECVLSARLCSWTPQPKLANSDTMFRYAFIAAERWGQTIFNFLTEKLFCHRPFPSTVRLIIVCSSLRHNKHLQIWQNHFNVLFAVLGFISFKVGRIISVQIQWISFNFRLVWSNYYWTFNFYETSVTGAVLLACIVYFLVLYF